MLFDVPHDASSPTNNNSDAHPSNKVTSTNDNFPLNAASEGAHCTRNDIVEVAPNAINNNISFRNNKESEGAHDVRKNIVGGAQNTNAINDNDVFRNNEESGGAHDNRNNIVGGAPNAIHNRTINPSFQHIDGSDETTTNNEPDTTRVRIKSTNDLPLYSPTHLDEAGLRRSPRIAAMKQNKGFQ